LVQVSIDATLISLMIILNILFGLLESRCLSFFQKLNQIHTSFNVIKHIELNPSSKVSWSALNTSLKIVSVVFCSADNGQNQMSLSQVLVLETFRNFVHYRHHDEIQKHVKNHISPIALRRARSSKPEPRNQNEPEEVDSAPNHVINQNLPPIVLDHRRCD